MRSDDVVNGDDGDAVVLKITMTVPWLVCDDDDNDDDAGLVVAIENSSDNSSETVDE